MANNMNGTFVFFFWGGRGGFCPFKIPFKPLIFFSLPVARWSAVIFTYCSSWAVVVVGGGG